MPAKKITRSTKSRRSARKAVFDAAGYSASLSAYQALLNADSWLMVAHNVVNAIGESGEGDKLEELRRSVAARLEYLQQAAYNALNAGGRAD